MRNRVASCNPVPSPRLINGRVADDAGVECVSLHCGVREEESGQNPDRTSGLHAGHFPISRFFCPNLVGAPPPAGKRCATTGGLRSSQTCTAECFRSRAEVFFARWHSCCFRSWAFCCSRFCCVGRREGVHHESRACPSQQTVQTAAYGASRRHHPGKIASSRMVYNPFSKE